MNMSQEEVSMALRSVSIKHKGEHTDFGSIRISDMADAAADAIDQLLAIIKAEKELKPVVCATEPCIYCNGGHALILDDENDRGIAIQYPNKLIAYGYDPHGFRSNGVSCIIEYCPMCGVKLGG